MRFNPSALTWALAVAQICTMLHAAAAQDAAPAQPPTPAAPAPAPAPVQPPGDPAASLDRILEDLARLDPALLQDRLTRTQSEIAKLKEENEALKAKIAANEAQLTKLNLQLLLLDTLIKVRGSLPAAPAPPAPAAPSPAAPPTPQASARAQEPAMAASAPPAETRAMSSAPPAPVPALAPAPSESPPSPPPAPAAVPASAAADAPPSQTPINYQDHVYPIFADHCLGCHNPDKAKGGLVLDSHAAALAGGGSGAVIAPGNPEGSRLMRLVSHLETPTMPPMRPRLSDDKLETIRRWIAAGAPADARSTGAASSAPSATSSAPPPAPSIYADAAPMPAPMPDLALRPAVQPPPVSAMAVSPAGPLLAVGGHEQILLFHLDEGRLLGAWDFPDGRVEDVCFSRDGTLLLAAGGLAGKRGQAVLLEVETGRRIAEFGRQYDAVLAADLSADGTLIAVGGSNRKVRVFDVYGGAMLYEIRDHTDWIEAVRFSPDGLMLATADRGGGLFLWESDTGRKVHELRGHSGAVHALAFQADSAVLAGGGRDGVVRLWAVEGGNVVRQISAHAGDCLDVEVAPDGRLATCGVDGRVRLWRGDGQELRSFEPAGEWVYQVGFSFDARKLVAGDWSGAVRVFDPETGANVHTFSTRPQPPARTAQARAAQTAPCESGLAGLAAAAQPG